MSATPRDGPEVVAKAIITCRNSNLPQESKAQQANVSLWEKTSARKILFSCHRVSAIVFEKNIDLVNI